MAIRRMFLALAMLGAGCANSGGDFGPGAEALTASRGSEARRHDAGTPSGPIRIAYGTEPQQFGDLRIPAGRGPHPVAVVIHGGCWTNFFGLELMDPISDALTQEGVATWNIEFRRSFDTGGGFPNTLTDVGMAVDYLRTLAPEYGLDLDRVVTVGHSSGGHLAVWVGARGNLAPGNPLRGEDPLEIAGAVGLAPILDVEAYFNINVCGEYVDDFIGGSPEDFPERYADTSPIDMLPLGFDVTIVQGTADDIVPPDLASDYARAARRAGDHVQIKRIQGGDHFTVITPTEPQWHRIRTAVLDLVRCRHR